MANRNGKRRTREQLSKLCSYGDERQAAKIASMKFDEHVRNCNTIPSEMCPCTTVHTLIEEIKTKTEHTAGRSC